jgi:hypothetical protein
MGTIPASKPSSYPNEEQKVDWTSCAGWDLPAGIPRYLLAAAEPYKSSILDFVKLLLMILHSD